MQECHAAATNVNKAASATTFLTHTALIPKFDACCTNRNTETGAWISITPTTIDGLSLSKDEWRDAMRQRYGLALLDIQKTCDGCGAKFTIKHALACKKGGLVVGRHNKVNAKTSMIAIHAQGK